MDIFNNIGKSMENMSHNISDLGIKVVRITRKSTRNGKLRYKLREEEKKLSQQYADLGEVYYNIQRGESHLNTKDINRLIQEIDKTSDSITSMENTIKYDQFEYDEDDFDYGLCTNCSKPLRVEDKFCSSCGCPVDVKDRAGIIYINEEDGYKDCPNCGHSVKTDSSHCDRCGRSFNM